MSRWIKLFSIIFSAPPPCWQTVSLAGPDTQNTKKRSSSGVGNCQRSFSALCCLCIAQENIKGSSQILRWMILMWHWPQRQSDRGREGGSERERTEKAKRRLLSSFSLSLLPSDSSVPSPVSSFYYFLWRYHCLNPFHPLHFFSPHALR